MNRLRFIISTVAAIAVLWLPAYGQDFVPQDSVAAAAVAPEGDSTAVRQHSTSRSGVPYKAILTSPRLICTGSGMQAEYKATVNYNISGGDDNVVIRFSCLWPDGSPVSNPRLDANSGWIAPGHKLMKEMEVELSEGRATGSLSVRLPGWMLPKSSFSSSFRIRIRAISPSGRTLATVNTPVVSISGKSLPF